MHGWKSWWRPSSRRSSAGNRRRAIRKEEGKTSKAPLTEAFGRWENAKVGLIALFGGTAGQAVVWYTGQFYALFFLTQTLKVDGWTANVLIAISLLIGTPFFIVFGWLSDKIGRKPIILGGCLIAALTYFPIFAAITHYANPALEKAQASSPVTVVANPAECSFQFNPVGTAKFVSSCDIAKSFLARNSVNYANEAAPAGTVASIKVGDKVIPSFSGVGLDAAAMKAQSDAFNASMTEAIRAAGYPAKADLIPSTSSTRPASMSRKMPAPWPTRSCSMNRAWPARRIGTRKPRRSLPA